MSTKEWHAAPHDTNQIRVEDAPAMLCSYRKSCKDIFILAFERIEKQKSRIALDRMFGKALFDSVLVVRGNHSTGAAYNGAQQV